MENRWFHKPHLHVPAPGKERKVGWLELFYDLIYVATFIQLGNALSDNVTVHGFLTFALLFVPLWYTWTGFTFFNNRYLIDDFAHRLLVFLQMFAIGAVGVTAKDLFVELHEPYAHVGFVLSYAAARIVLVILYARSHFQLTDLRGMTSRFVVGFSVGAVLWIASAFVPAPYFYLVGLLALAVDLSVPLSKQARELTANHPPDEEHMAERYGLLTIIVLGESFVKILTAISDLAQPQAREILAHRLAEMTTKLDPGLTGSERFEYAAELTEIIAALGNQQTPGWNVILMGSLALVVTCSLWWIYFDDVAGSSIKKGPLAAYVWIYAHLPLAIAITASGVAVKKAVLYNPMEPATKYTWLVCGTLALAFLSVAIIDSVAERRHSEMSDRARINVRLLAVGLMLLLGGIATNLPYAWIFVAVVSGICIMQVVFDISMAPMMELEHPEHHGHGHEVVHENTDEEIEAKAPNKRWDIGDSVRKGTPNELRRDLYFHLMEGSWLRVFVTMVSLYLISNAVFAALYMLDPSYPQSLSLPPLEEGDPLPFLDAFAFSVQTMTTIGFGTLSPTTIYANILVTMEAGVGVLGLTILTGLMFAKASRPSSSVLFSNAIVVTQYDGAQVLAFRAGNARGNDVVEANVRVSALVEEVSPEGHSMRKLHNLDLRRSETPVFAMTWTIFHDLNEDSPLFNISEGNVEDVLVTLIVTMTGLDATYAQHTHARKLYYPENFRFDEWFVDVISTLDDGRLMVDYEHFHATVPNKKDDG